MYNVTPDRTHQVECSNDDRYFGRDLMHTGLGLVSTPLGAELPRAMGIGPR